MARLSKEEIKWRAESDAHTLIEAGAIKQNKTRFKRAVTEAKRLAKEAEDKAKAAKKVVKAASGNSTKKKVARKK